jgi:hypothetical protein
MSRPFRLSPLLAWALMFTLGLSFWAAAPAQTATATTLPSSTVAELSAFELNPKPHATACIPNPKRDLVGSLIADNRAKITNRSRACTYEVGLAAYSKFDNIIDRHQLFDASTAKVRPGQTIALRVKLPSCAAQVNLFYGPVLRSLKGQRYGERLLAARHLGSTNFCVPNATATPTKTSGQNCTYTIGYWKNHQAAWPVASLTIGGITYTQAQLLNILNTPPGGDATYILAHQLIAAKLNVAQGANGSAVASTIATSDTCARAPAWQCTGRASTFGRHWL